MRPATSRVLAASLLFASGGALAQEARHGGWLVGDYPASDYPAADVLDVLETERLTQGELAVAIARMRTYRRISAPWQLKVGPIMAGLGGIALGTAYASRAVPVLALALYLGGALVATVGGVLLVVGAIKLLVSFIRFKVLDGRVLTFEGRLIEKDRDPQLEEGGPAPADGATTRALPSQTVTLLRF